METKKAREGAIEIEKNRETRGEMETEARTENRKRCRERESEIQRDRERNRATETFKMFPRPRDHQKGPQGQSLSLQSSRCTISLRQPELVRET